MLLSTLLVFESHGIQEENKCISVMPPTFPPTKSHLALWQTKQ